MSEMWTDVSGVSKGGESSPHLRGDRIVLGEIPLTPRAQKVIELAVDEARRLNHDYIGTGHLLLGLVREGEGIAVGALESQGVNLEKVRTETIRVLNQRKDS